MRSEPPALTAAQRHQLATSLANDALSSFAAGRLARGNLAVGHYDAAIARLRVDADKLRTVDPALAALVTFPHSAAEH